MSESYTISTNARDNVVIVSHKIYIDEIEVKDCAEATICTYNWDTTNYSGTVSIKAEAIDSSNNRDSRTHIVTVEDILSIYLNNGFNKIKWKRTYPGGLNASEAVFSINEDCGDGSTKVVARKFYDQFSL